MLYNLYRVEWTDANGKHEWISVYATTAREALVSTITCLDLPEDNVTVWAPVDPDEEDGV